MSLPIINSNIHSIILFQSKNLMTPSEIIRSKTNKWVQLCSSIHQGRKDSKPFFLAEGMKSIKSLLSSYKPLVLLSSESFSNDLAQFNDTEIECRIVSDQLWPSLSEVQSPTKLIGIFHKPVVDLPSFSNATEIIVIDQVQDPGNLGTIIRTAVASGWQNMICLKGTVDPFSPKVVRASAGALGGIKIVTSIEINPLMSFLKDGDFTIINSSSHATNDLRTLELNKIRKPCLILGNEGGGSSYAWSEEIECLQIKIPLQNEQQVESLNVAIAGALLMYKLKGMI
jgi:TrmH family RNA methyltransferase